MLFIFSVYSSRPVLDWDAVPAVSRFLRNVQRSLGSKLSVVSIANHDPGTGLVRRTVFGRFLSGPAFRQLRYVPAVSASVRRMRVAHQLYNVPLAVVVANRPVSHNLCPGVCYCWLFTRRHGCSFLLSSNDLALSEHLWCLIPALFFFLSSNVRRRCHLFYLSFKCCGCDHT